MKTNKVEYKYGFLLVAIENFIDKKEIPKDHIVLDAFAHVLSWNRANSEEERIHKKIVKYANS